MREDRTFWKMSMRQSLAEFDRRFVYNADGRGEVIERLKDGGFQIIGKDAFGDVWGWVTAPKADDEKKREPVAPVWLRKHRKRNVAYGLTFDPDTRRADPRKFNTWSGFAIKAGASKPPTDWELLRDQLIIDNHFGGDRSLAGAFLVWAAHMRQRPGERPHWAALLGSTEEGTGKDTVANYLRQSIGRRHAKKIGGLGQITGRFAQFASRMVLVTVSEVYSKADPRAEDRLKDLVDAPSMSLEEKYKPIGEDHDLFFRLLCSTNHDHAMRLAGGSRRWLAQRVGAKYEQDRRFFADLHEQMRRGGLERMAWDLDHLDPKEWGHDWSIVFGSAPETPWLREQRFATLVAGSPQDAVFVELVLYGEVGCDQFGVAPVTANEHEQTSILYDGMRKVYLARLRAMERLRPDLFTKWHSPHAMKMQVVK